MTLLTDFIFVAGMVVMAILIFLLVRSRPVTLPRRILVTLFAYMLVTTLAFYSDLHDLDVGIILTYIFQDHIEFVVGPLLYLYIKSLFELEKNFLRRHWLHFLPALIYTVSISIPFLISVIKRKAVFSYLLFLMENDSFIMLFHALYLILYCLLSLRLLNRYEDTMRLNFSNLKEKDLSWVRYLLIGVLVVISIDLSTSIYEVISGNDQYDTGYITVVAMIFVIFYLGYFGTTQSRILIPSFLLEKPEVPAIVDSKSDLPSHHLAKAESDEIERLKNKLNEVLLNDKPYLNEELTLGALAEMIPTTDKKLSALLNHYMDITFYDLINQYRVEEVKAKMADDDFESYTLLALAFDSGFKSKTSFNRIFKKTTGYSPSAYKKQI